MVDGVPAPSQQTAMAPDGNTLLAWDSTTNNPGESSYLQTHLTLNGTNVTADGPILVKPTSHRHSTGQPNQRVGRHGDAHDNRHDVRTLRLSMAA